MAEGPGDEPVCRLEQSVGRTASCPGDACVFWEPGGAVLDGRCILEGVELTHEPELAAWLVDVRELLQHAAHR